MGRWCSSSALKPRNACKHTASTVVYDSACSAPLNTSCAAGGDDTSTPTHLPCPNAPPPSTQGRPSRRRRIWICAKGQVHGAGGLASAQGKSSTEQRARILGCGRCTPPSKKPSCMPAVLSQQQRRPSGHKSCTARTCSGSMRQSFQDMSDRKSAICELPDGLICCTQVGAQAGAGVRRAAAGFAGPRVACSPVSVRQTQPFLQSQPHHPTAQQPQPRSPKLLRGRRPNPPNFNTIPTRLLSVRSVCPASAARLLPRLVGVGDSTRRVVTMEGMGPLAASRSISSTDSTSLRRLPPLAPPGRNRRQP